jgi:hypothetical protein
MLGEQIVRRTSLLAVAASTAFAVLVAASVPSAGAAGPETGYSFSGWAAGTLVKSPSGQVLSDFTAPSSINGSSLSADTNRAASVSVPSTVVTGAVSTSTTASEISGGYQVRSVSQVARLVALGGAIKADALVVVTVAKVVNGIASSSSVTTFSNLTISGVHVPADIPPNLVVRIPGASMILNASISTTIGSQSVISGTGILITLTKALGAFLPGTSISIAPTFASIAPLQAASGHVLYGHSFGTKVLGSALAGTGISAKESAPITLPPGGTSGTQLTNQVVGVALDPRATVGHVTDSVSGTNTASGYVGRASASVSTVNLFDGVVRADAVTSTAVVRGTASAADPSTLAASSTATNLVIDGKVYTSVPPNTRVTLPFGWVTINQRIRTGTHALIVRGLDIHFTAAAYGFPTGTEIQLATSRIAVS